MGNALVCFEKGHWDSHSHVHAHYKPAAEPRQDMTQPLSHYFISSGHNSYLSGNQLTSDASTSTIDYGLKQGCRVIELDVYDGPKGDPICTHGGTLTSAVRFEQCVKTIARHGFVHSPYPVILTIENHAGVEQQGTMAAHLHQILGTNLFTPTPEQLTSSTAWLSPEDLKNKVIVRMKVKDTTNPDLAKLVYIRNTSIKGYDLAAGPAVPASHSLPETKLPSVPEYARFEAGSSRSMKWKSSIQHSRTRRGDSTSSKSLHSRHAGASFDERAKEGGDLGRGPAPAVGTDDSAARQGMTATVRTTAAASSEPDRGKRSPMSLKQAAAAEAQLKQAEEQDDTCSDDDTAVTGECGLKTPGLANVLRYGLKHLLRVYPSGKRMLDNSNPSPMPSWAVGASLAALNWQLADEPMWINEAFFARQDSCGYILKPDWMRADLSAGGLPEREPRTLAITIYSAFKFQGRKMGVYKDDPYVELKMLGIPVDTESCRTKHIYDSGRLVVNETYRFHIHFPEMAVLLILLKDMDVGTTDPVHGYASLPVSTLTEGEYQIRLAKPYAMGAKPEAMGMWVKLKLEWEDSGVAGGEQKKDVGVVDTL